MRPDLKSLTFAIAMIGSAAMVSTATTGAMAQPVHVGHELLVQHSPVSAEAFARFHAGTPRGPTFADRVSYPRYLGGYGIGPSARRTLEKRTGVKTKHFLKRWSSRHDTGYTLR